MGWIDESPQKIIHSLFTIQAGDTVSVKCCRILSAATLEKATSSLPGGRPCGPEGTASGGQKWLHNNNDHSLAVVTSIDRCLAQFKEES